MNNLFNNIQFSSANFKVTPEELHRQSSSVSGNVKNMKNRFNNLERIVRTTTSYWKGDAADDFRGVYDSFKDEIDIMIARLSEHITDLERMAGVYEEAEAKVSEIIESLPSDVII